MVKEKDNLTELLDENVNNQVSDDGNESKNIDEKIAVEDIKDSTIDVDTLDPETLEVEKLIDPEEVKEEPIEVPNYEEEIVKIIRGISSPKVIRSKLEDYHDNNIADALKLLKKTERQKLYRILNKETLGAIFEYVSKEDASIYINEMDLKKASNVISELEPDTAVDILRELEKSKRTLLIDSMESDVRKDIKVVASFDEDEIGSKMTTNCIIINDDLTISEAMDALVKQAKENDNISTIFVEDKDNAFVGAIDLKELIIAKKTMHLKDLIMTSFPYVYGHENIDDCIERLKDYSEGLIPVLDNNNRILGVITSQNLVEVVDEEMGEDYAKFAGLTAEEDLSEPLIESLKKRLPWLLILLGLGMFVSSVVGIFEGVIAGLPIIMAFQTLILDMSGNVGTQSLAVTIRVLMDENLTFKQKVDLFWKEVRVGFCNGLILASLSFVFLGLYIHFVKDRPWSQAYSISGCIGISLIVAMIISSTLGTLIPMFFKKIKVDPAVASGPLITTLNDLIAVVTYYGVSWILLINVLHLGQVVG
ncbi:MAG: magnesium transporter [Lachnospiraceae bacterium]|nr:magnesium transporter [Lachnospiraceae bacterium]